MTSSNWSNPVLKVRALTEISERRKRPSTYTDPLTKSPDMKEFLQDFYKNIYRQEKKEWYRAERSKYPALQKNYDDLCGKTVSYEDFWMRYERRCNLDRVMKELADRDAAQVEQTKKAVSSYIHKAWSAVPTTSGAEEEGTSRESSATGATGTTGEGTVMTTASIKTSQAKDENVQASPQTSMRESISKVLGTSSWSTPSSMVPSPPPSKEKPKVLPVNSEHSEEQPEQSKPNASTIDQTGIHGVKKTEKQNSILDELKKKLAGNKKTTIETAAKPVPPPTALAKIADSIQPISSSPSEPIASKSDDPPIHDNQMADAAALLLLIVFLIVTNLLENV
jgi:BSD domain